MVNHNIDVWKHQEVEKAYRNLMIERKLVKADEKIDDQDLQDDEDRYKQDVLLLAVPNLTGQD